MKKLPLPSSAIVEKKQTPVAPKKRGNRETRVPQIIDVSLNVLIDAGYGGYAINRVANDAGIRLSTLQHYFPSREALLHATIEEIGKRYFERFRALAEQAGRTPMQRLEAILDDAYAELSLPGLPASIFEAWGLALHEQYARDIIVGIQKRFESLFGELVREINPGLSPAEQALRGALLMSSLEGLIVFLRWSEDSGERRQAFRSAMKVVWNGLSTAD